MTKLSKIDLNKIFSLANKNFLDLPRGDLDMQEHMAACWLRAVDSLIGLRLEVEFPKRPFPEPED